MKLEIKNSPSTEQVSFSTIRRLLTFESSLDGQSEVVNKRLISFIEANFKQERMQTAEGKRLVELAISLLFLNDIDAFSSISTELQNWLTPTTVMDALVELSKLDPLPSNEAKALGEWNQRAPFLKRMRFIFYPGSDTNKGKKLPSARAHLHEIRSLSRHDYLTQLTLETGYSRRTKELLERGICFLAESCVSPEEIINAIRLSNISQQTSENKGLTQDELDNTIKLKISERAAYLWRITSELLEHKLEEEVGALNNDIYALYWLEDVLDQLALYAFQHSGNVEIQLWKSESDQYRTYPNGGEKDAFIPEGKIIDIETIKTLFGRARRLYKEIKRGAPTLSTQIKKTLVSGGSPAITIDRRNKEQDDILKKRKDFHALEKRIQSSIMEKTCSSLIDYEKRIDFESKSEILYMGFLHFICWVCSMAELHDIKIPNKILAAYKSILTGKENDYVSFESVLVALMNERSLISQLCLRFSMNSDRSNLIYEFHSLDVHSAQAFISGLLYEISDLIFHQRPDHPIFTSHQIFNQAFSIKSSNTPLEKLMSCAHSIHGQEWKKDGEITYLDWQIAVLNSYRKPKPPLKIMRRQMQRIQSKKPGEDEISHELAPTAKQLKEHRMAELLREKKQEVQKNMIFEGVGLGLSISFILASIFYLNILINQDPFSSIDMRSVNSPLVSLAKNIVLIRELLPENRESVAINRLPYNPFFGFIYKSKDDQYQDDHHIGFMPEQIVGLADYEEKIDFEILPIEDLSFDIETNDLLIDPQTESPTIFPPSGYRIKKVYASYPHLLESVSGGAVRAKEGKLIAYLEHIESDQVRLIGEGNNYSPETNFVEIDKIKTQINLLKTAEDADTHLLQILDTTILNLEKILETSESDLTEEVFQEKYSSIIMDLVHSLFQWSREHTYYNLRGVKKIENSLLLGMIRRSDTDGFYCGEAADLVVEILNIFNVRGGISNGRFVNLYSYQSANYLFGSDIGHAVAIVHLPNGKLLAVDITPPVTAQTPLSDLMALVPSKPSNFHEVRRYQPKTQLAGENLQQNKPFLEAYRDSHNQENTIDLTLFVSVLATILASRIVGYRIQKDKIKLNFERRRQFALANKLLQIDAESQKKQIIDQLVNFPIGSFSDQIQQKWFALLLFFGTSTAISIQSIEKLLYILLNARTPKNLELAIEHASNLIEQKYPNFMQVYLQAQLEFSLINPGGDTLEEFKRVAIQLLNSNVVSNPDQLIGQN